MNARTIGVIAVLGLALSACVGSAGIRRGTYGKNIDEGKVLAVEKWAQGHGAKVIWVSLPTRSEPKANR